MILITKNSSNNVYLTLTEKSTLASPFYLFQFDSLDGQSSILFTAADTSSNTDRYNKFTMVETSGATNYTAGTISLNPGEYNYYAYEMTGSTNLSLTGITSMVEQGQVFVSGATSTSYTYTSNDSTSTDVYFNN